MTYYNQNQYNQYQDNLNINEVNYNSNQSQEKEEEIQEEIKLNIRLGFIRKVYGILAIQLLITSIFTFICMNSTQIQFFLITHKDIFSLNLILEIILSIVIIFCRGLSRQVPYNYIILLAFTLSESYIVGSICCFYEPKIVFMAAVMTFIMVIFLTIYAFTTKTDVTMTGSLLFLLASSLLSLFIFNIFLTLKIIHVIFCCLCVFIFGIYIVYDTQIIIGKHTFALEVDDYILGAFLIYTDIISIFIYILSLFNSSNE